MRQAFVLALVVGCRSYTHVPVTPWLRETHWVNENIIAESGAGRGGYVELTNERGYVVKIDAWGCESIDDGRAVLCHDSSEGPAGRSLVLRRSGERRSIACPEQPPSIGTTFGSVQKHSEREVVCVQLRYEPSHIEIVTRMDLEGRVLERRESEDAKR